MAIAFVASHTGQNKGALSNVATAGVFPQTAGETLFAFVTFDNLTATTPTVSSLSKYAGEPNTWAKIAEFNSPQAAAAGGVRGELWRINLSVFGGDASVNAVLSATVTAKAIVVLRFTGVGALVAAPVTATAASGAASASAGAVPAGALALTMGGTEAAAVPTQSGGDVPTAMISNGTTGGSAVTNAWAAMGYEVFPSGRAATTWGFIVTDGGSITAFFNPTPDPVLSQAAFRFYADGTESGSTALAAQDTAPAVDTSGGDVPLALRVRLQETGTGPVPVTSDFQLQYEKNASGSWVNVLPPAVSSYTPEATSAFGIEAVSYPSLAQSFMGDGRTLVRARFVLSQGGSANGTVRAELRAHDAGTFGGTGKPGAVLASSTTIIQATALPGGAGAWFDFDFTPYTLAAGTAYFIGVTATASTNFVSVWQGGNTAPGAGWRMSTAGAWTSVGDTIHEVIAPEANAVLPYESANLTGEADTTSRLTGGTGTFSPGEVDEDGIVEDRGWPQGNHTELLYSIRLRAADLAPSDTLRFRVLRNGAVLDTYAQVPTLTIGAGGPQTFQVSGIVPVATTVAAVSTVINQVRDPSVENTTGLSGYYGLNLVTGTRSSAWSSNRTKSLMLVSTGLDSFGYVEGDVGGLALGMLPGRTYTAKATIHLDAPQTGTLHERARKIFAVVNAPSVGGYADFSSLQPPNVAGTYDLSVTFSVPADATMAFIRLYNGADSGNGTVYWDSVMVTEGVYSGPYIDGATGGTWQALAEDSVTVVNNPMRVPVTHQVSGTVAVATTATGAATVIVPAVTHQVSGTVAVATAATGAVTQRQQVTGVVPVTTGLTGDVTSRHAVAGSVPVVVGVAGDVTARHAVAGTVPVLTTVSGALTSRQAISGTVPVVTSVAGDATVIGAAVQHQVSGTVAVVTNAYDSGAVTQRQGVSGSIAVVTAASGAITQRQQVQGTVPVVTGASGAVTRVPITHAVSGVVAVTTTPSGAVTAKMNVSGVVPVVTAAVGDATIVSTAVQHQVAGTVAVTTGLTGDATRVPITHQVSGVVAVTTVPTGAVTSRLVAAGSVAVNTGVAGAVTQRQQAAGVVAVTTGAAGAATVSPKQVSGAVAVNTGVSGGLTAQFPVAGTVPIVTSASAVVGTGLAVSGVVPVVTSASGVITKPSTAAGVVAVGTGVSGAVSHILAVSGTVAVTTGASGAVTSKQNVSGVVPVVTTAIGNPLPPGGASGTVPVVTGVAGSVTSRHQISGTVAVNTGVSGAVTSKQGVTGRVDVVTAVSGAAQIGPRGRADVVTGVSGAVTQRHQVAGTVAVVSSASGTLAGGSGVSGVVPVTVGVSGAVSVIRAVSGVVAVQTGAAGVVGAGRAVSGLVAVSTNVVGGLYMVFTAAGTVAVLSEVIGRVTGTMNVFGRVDVLTTASGTVIRPGAPEFPTCLGLRVDSPLYGLSAAAVALGLRADSPKLDLDAHSPSLTLGADVPGYILRTEASC